MTGENSSLALTLPANPDNVAVVRHALGGLAEAIGMESEVIADLKTVVTEACMNVAVHAYGEGTGPMEVTAEPQEDGLRLKVRDFGSGIQPTVEIRQESLRLGLPLIAALARNFEISGAVGQGTTVEVYMPFSREREEPSQAPATPKHMDSDAIVSVTTREMAAPVASRLLSMVAARAHMPLDRLSDTVLLGDAISAFAAEGFTNGMVRFEIEDTDDAIEFRIGPMLDGAAEKLRRDLELPDLGATLEKLADEVRVTRGDPGEYLALRVTGGDAAGNRSG